MTHFRLVVVARGVARGKTYKGRGPTHRGAYTAIAPRDYAYIYWTPDTTAEPWREDYGSFVLAGIYPTRAAIVAAFSDPRTRQVSIRTNQDKTLYVMNRREDGRITIYNAKE